MMTDAARSRLQGFVRAFVRLCKFWNDEAMLFGVLVVVVGFGVAWSVHVFDRDMRAIRAERDAAIMAATEECHLRMIEAIARLRELEDK
jgi:hypothetical protein